MEIKKETYIKRQISDRQKDKEIYQSNITTKYFF